MRKKDTRIAVIISILTIIVFLSTILINGKTIAGWFTKNPSASASNSNDLDLILEPRYINEGSYNEIPIKITIPINEKNISYLRLSKSNIVINRLNKNEQTKTSSLYKWGDYSKNEDAIYYSEPSTIGFTRNLTSFAYLWGCDNCFMGENSPYQFIFTIQYQKNNGPLQVVVIEKTIPII